MKTLNWIAWHMRLLCQVYVLTACLVVSVCADQAPGRATMDYANYVHHNQHILRPPAPSNPIPDVVLTPPLSPPQSPISPPINPLSELHDALSTLQNTFFAIWLGKWPTAIDWTAAVMGTHLSAALHTLSTSFAYTMPGTFSKDKALDVEAQMVENDINRYFGHSVTYYFGEDHFAIRNEAYDDMLWVVLGWLESVDFINTHSRKHYAGSGGGEDAGVGREWHGTQFIPAFAHRARVFYELASKGWDWKLCGGGMNWSPHTQLPYKNAITNELFIAASAGMYLGFPGDGNCEPFFGTAKDPTSGTAGNLTYQDEHATACLPGPDGEYKLTSTYDPVYLQAAINGYEWLKNSGMTNNRGLYVDGFHIHDYGKDGGIGTGKCDERNEMVYTYNQGVLLSGLRGLWESTGETSYLEDGHELIRNVIGATGWNESFEFGTSDTRNASPPPNGDHETDEPLDWETDFMSKAEWRGLGGGGILTELCDPFGTCSQNGQTFKGIFFHHLTSFCQPLPSRPRAPGKTHAASREVRMLHRVSCRSYTPWVVRNARAALSTRDVEGRFGMWWGAGYWEGDERRDMDLEEGIRRVFGKVVPQGAIDYENDEELLRKMGGLEEKGERVSGKGQKKNGNPKASDDIGTRDLNDRGRGRTVETQGGGVAVVRAMWEFVRGFGEDDEP